MLGDVAAELLDDTASLACPVGRAEMETALRFFPFGPWPTVTAAAPRPALDAALRLQHAEPAVLEVEIDPLIPFATEAVAADAVVVRRCP